MYIRFYVDRQRDGDAWVVVVEELCVSAFLSPETRERSDVRVYLPRDRWRYMWGGGYTFVYTTYVSCRERQKFLSHTARLARTHRTSASLSYPPLFYAGRTWIPRALPVRDLHVALPLPWFVFSWRELEACASAARSAPSLSQKCVKAPHSPLSWGASFVLADSLLTS